MIFEICDFDKLPVRYCHFRMNQSHLTENIKIVYNKYIHCKVFLEVG